MIAFLPPISAMTRLTWSWPGRHDGGLAVDQQADVARAGEGDQIDLGMVDQRLADLLAQARQIIEHAGRQAGFVEELGQVPGDDRRLLGRLQDDGVAGDERGDRHAGGDRQREVPGRDDHGDAARMGSVKFVSPEASRCLGSARRHISRA